MPKYSQMQKKTSIDGIALPFSILLISLSLWPRDTLISRAGTLFSILSCVRRFRSRLSYTVHHCFYTILRIFIYKKDCPDCNGTGYDPYDGGQCDRCSGTGTVDR